MESLFLSLGSDIGDRKNNLEQAYELISEKIGPVVRKSEFYENEAEGFESENLFLNSCIEVNTNLKSEKILDELQAIEKLLGRSEKSIDQKYSSRIIDIDIILYGSHIIEQNKLTIPHKLYRKRTFVLIPLSEIAPNQIDPITQLTVKQLLELNSKTF